MLDDDENIHGAVKPHDALGFNKYSVDGNGNLDFTSLVHSSRTDRPGTALGRLRVPTSHSGTHVQ
jgi:hypothetical protein